MEKTFIYSGYIETDLDNVIYILKTFLDASNITDRYAVDIEREVKYRDEKIDIYSYKYSEKGSLFQVELNGTNEEAQSFIDTITEKLREDSIVHQFEWNEVDENEDQVGEEFEIRFPED